MWPSSGFTSQGQKKKYKYCPAELHFVHKWSKEKLVVRKLISNRYIIEQFQWCCLILVILKSWFWSLLLTRNHWGFHHKAAWKAKHLLWNAVGCYRNQLMCFGLTVELFIKNVMASWSKLRGKMIRSCPNWQGQSRIERSDETHSAAELFVFSSMYISIVSLSTVGYLVNSLSHRSCSYSRAFGKNWLFQIIVLHQIS